MSLLSNILKKQSASSQPVNAPTGQQLLLKGQLLSNRYLVSDTLGRGAMGEVYLAEDTVLGGVSVAIKVISQPLPTKAMVDKFSREAQIGAFLGHHNVNIVRVLDFGVHNGDMPFYVMEYVYGTTLTDEIERNPLSIRRAVRLMSQVCAGLQSAHQGVLIEKKLYSVIHRDLKPGNIFLTNNSSFGEIAKILDFGISEFFQPTHKSTEADAMGTLAYGSPEQLLGHKLEPSSDIYSFGITLFEAITGQLPIQPVTNTVHAWIEAHRHQPPRPLKLVAPQLQVPQALETLIQKCLEKKPKKRPQSIQEVLDSLKQISDSLGENFPIAAPSHEDVLNEIFGGADSTPPVAAPLAQSTPAPPTQMIQPSASASQTRIIQPSAPAAATLNIQPAKAPRNQTRPIQQKPQNIAQQWAWPTNKPMAEIVFAQTIQAPDIEQAALWAMLNHAEQQWKSMPCHHIEFMVELDPYPMLAWVTVLHDKQGHMRCLPCFIGLGDAQRQTLVQNLIQQSEYLFLLFGQKNPQRPAQVSTFKIDAHQQQFLNQNWIKARRIIQQKNSQLKSQNAALAASKQKLKARYKTLKAELPTLLKQKVGY